VVEDPVRMVRRMKYSESGAENDLMLCSLSGPGESLFHSNLPLYRYG
jgi:hypothetical protein